MPKSKKAMYDMEISWDNGEKLKLKVTSKKLVQAGQHGAPTILTDSKKDKWLLKIFDKIIDKEFKTITDLEVDFHGTPEENKDRLHLWRCINEFTASRIANNLELKVPKAILITHANVSNFTLKGEDPIKLGEDIIILDEEDGAPETVENFYSYSQRESYTIKFSAKMDEVLSEDSIAVLIKFVPDSENLDYFLNENDFDEAMEQLKDIDDGFFLLPFDIWLNDPDRNAANYLIKFKGKKSVKKATEVYGLDYEMWAFGDDTWMDLDEITKGRSYLTAVIHGDTHIFDPRILSTIYKISSISDEELKTLTNAPAVICQFFEYHISQGNIEAEERDILSQIEQNLWDFLYETRPRLDMLTERIINQIGYPKDFKK